MARSTESITLQYRNNLPLVSIAIIDAGSNKKVAVGKLYDNMHVGCLDLPERTPATAQPQDMP